MASPVPDDLFVFLWRERTKEQILTLYRTKGDFESMVRIFVYLEDDFSKGTTPPAWFTLQNVFQKNPESIERVADDMVEQTKIDPLLNEAYMNIMTDLLGKLGAEGAMVPKKEFADAEKMDFEVVHSLDIVCSGVEMLLQGVIQYSLLRQLIINRQALLSIDELVNLVNQSAGSIILVGLASIYVGTMAIKILVDWWHGKITGVRCIKEIIDSTVTITAGVVGGMAGGAVGGAVSGGPIGAVVGGIFGGLWTSNRANYFIDYMTTKLFGIPQDSALENAYKFFDVDMTASNEEINKAYRTMCLKHHPDKGGKNEDFIEVQLHMGVIKVARGDMS